MSHCKENVKCRICPLELELWDDWNESYPNIWRCPDGHYTYELIKIVDGVIHTKEEILFGAEYPVLRINQPDNIWQIILLQSSWKKAGPYHPKSIYTNTIILQKIIDISPFEVGTSLEIIKKKLETYVTFS